MIRAFLFFIIKGHLEILQFYKYSPISNVVEITIHFFIHLEYNRKIKTFINYSLTFYINDLSSLSEMSNIQNLQ